MTENDYGRKSISHTLRIVNVNLKSKAQELEGSAPLNLFLTVRPCGRNSNVVPGILKPLFQFRDLIASNFYYIWVYFSLQFPHHSIKVSEKGKGYSKKLFLEEK